MSVRVWKAASADDPADSGMLKAQRVEMGSIGP